MSYDLYLRDPVTKEQLEVPGHMMFGGNIPCKVIDGQLVPVPTTEAYLNITYNYSGYYQGAFPGMSSDPEAQAQYDADCEKYGITDSSGGIRSLNGLTGVQAAPLLEEMIRRIEAKYKDEEGNWITTKRDKAWYVSKKDGHTTKTPAEVMIECIRHAKEYDGDAGDYVDERYERHEDTEMVSEGSTGDYWQATAANAIRPLHQLIALSQMRPDGVWSEES